MKNTLLIIAAICVFSVASMVPRDQRTVPEQIKDAMASYPTSASKICAPKTPCGWSVYRRNTKVIDINITNTYCKCGIGYECVMTGDDEAVFSYILHCRSSSQITTEPES